MLLTRNKGIKMFILSLFLSLGCFLPQGAEAYRGLPYFFSPPLPFWASSMMTTSSPQLPVVEGSTWPTIPYIVQKIAGQGENLVVIYERSGFDLNEDAPIAQTGLAVFSMTDPEQPELLGQLELPALEEDDRILPLSIEEVILVEDLAFLFQKFPAYLWVIDLSDPTDPQLFTTLGFEEVSMTHLAVFEDLICVALNGQDKEENGIYAFSISGSDHPEIVTFLPFEEKIGTFLINEQGYVFVFGQKPNQGNVFDLQAVDPSVSLAPLEQAGENAVLLGDRLYLATGYTEIQSRLHLLDLTNPQAPNLIESINLIGRELQVMTQKDRILVWKSSAFNTTHYLEILEPGSSDDSLEKISTIHFSSPPKGLACNEDSFFLLDERGLRVLDLADPNQPLWGDPIDLTIYFENSVTEQIDPIFEDPLTDDIDKEEQNLSLPWANFFSPWSPLAFNNRGGWGNFIEPKGYGPVTVDAPYSYGLSSGLSGFWPGNGPRSNDSSFSCDYSFGNMLTGFDNSFSYSSELFNFPFSFMLSPEFFM